MDQDSDNRRRPRISTMILCELNLGENSVELARVRDLSEHGIKIATNRILLVGDRIHVRLPGASNWVMARVVWCEKGVAGLSFVRAIDLPQVSGAQLRGRAAKDDALVKRAAG